MTIKNQKFGYDVSLVVMMFLIVAVAGFLSWHPAEAVPNAFFEGVQRDDEALIRQAYDENPSLIESVGVGGQTPLIHAVLTGRLVAVRTLLELGADTTATEKDGYNVMHAAGFQGRAEILEELLLPRRGLVDPLMRQHPDGYYPMHRSCWGREQRHTDTVRVFLDKGGVSPSLAAANGKTCEEMTPNEGTKALILERTEEGYEL
jgi:ankyrin repeat protein